MKIKCAKFSIGQIVKHKRFPFRGVIFDVDYEFSNSEEWYSSIPIELRPDKNQPFYHIFAQNDLSHYIAYVSEQNLIEDDDDLPITHPNVKEIFSKFDNETQKYIPINRLN